MVLNETHLRRLLREYLSYYHGARTHLSLAKDAPEPRRVERVPSFSHPGLMEGPRAVGDRAHRASDAENGTGDTCSAPIGGIDPPGGRGGEALATRGTHGPAATAWPVPPRETRSYAARRR